MPSSEGVDGGLAAAINTAVEHLASLGAEIVELDLGLDLNLLGQTWFELCSREVFEAHSDTYPELASEYGRPVSHFLAMGASISDSAYRAAQENRAALNRQFTSELAKVDGLVAPAGIAFPVLPEQLYGAPGIYEEYEAKLPGWFTFPADLAGTPALTLPCGASAEGIPYGMQIMGSRLSEATLCRIGQAYEDTTDWKDRHPPI